MRFTDEEKKNIQDLSKEYYLETEFIHHADKKRFVILQEDLENDFIKGIENTYPTTVIKAYQLLNDLRHYDSSFRRDNPNWIKTTDERNKTWIFLY